VPLGKVKTERLIPVDSFVCQLVERLRLLRSQDPLPADGFLLARTSGRDALIRELRNYWRDLVANVGITRRIVPHQLRHYAASGTIPHVDVAIAIPGRLSGGFAA
jgi:integrase